jgi:hypothetical protein
MPHHAIHFKCYRCSQFVHSVSRQWIMIRRKNEMSDERVYCIATFIPIYCAHLQQYNLLTLVGISIQNYRHKEIKSRLNLVNACYHSVQYRLSSRLLYYRRNAKKEYRKTIILPVVLHEIKPGFSP